MAPTDDRVETTTVDEALATLRRLRYHVVEGKPSTTGWEARRLADGGAVLSVPPTWAGQAQTSATAIVADLRVRGVDAVAQVLDVHHTPVFTGVIALSGRRIRPRLADVAGYVHNQSGWPRARARSPSRQPLGISWSRVGDGGIDWSEAGPALDACYRESRPGRALGRPATTLAHHLALGALLRTLLTPLGYRLRDHGDGYAITRPEQPR